MTVRDVPRSDWRSFLERFSAEHRAWIGTIHGIVAGAPVTHIPSVALKSVTLERGPSGRILRLTFVNGVSLCVVRPRRVRVQTDDGAERALEIETADEGFIRLAFRARALPEQLDGLAPGEVPIEGQRINANDGAEGESSDPSTPGRHQCLLRHLRTGSSWVTLTRGK
jgi:hypothetical protein